MLHNSHDCLDVGQQFLSLSVRLHILLLISWMLVISLI